MNTPYPWLTSAWQELQALKPKLPSVLLLHGPPNIGKLSLGMLFAQSLLCEASTTNNQENLSSHGLPCLSCPACKWFTENNHPDFRLVQPSATQAKLTTEENQSDNLSPVGKSKGTGTAGTKISIQQIQTLLDFLYMTTHRHGLRIAILEPTHTINVEAANALLKSLEEPLPQTLILLITAYPERLLPTLRSRCTHFPIAPPPASISIPWLEKQGVQDAEIQLAEGGYSPLLALEQYHHSGEHKDHQSFLELIDNISKLGAIAVAEECQKWNAQQISRWLTLWVADILLYYGTGEIRWHPQHQESISKLASRIMAKDGHQYYRQLINASRLSTHPFNVKLLAETLLLDYQKIFSSTSRLRAS